MGGFRSLGSLKCSNIAGHKGPRSTKVPCVHVHKRNVVGQSGNIYAELVPFIFNIVGYL